MAAGSSEGAGVKDRLLSLDLFRGLTMFLLIGESTRIYEHLLDPSLKGSLIYAIGTQFDHHPWNGLGGQVAGGNCDERGGLGDVVVDVLLAL